MIAGQTLAHSANAESALCVHRCEFGRPAMAHAGSYLVRTVCSPGESQRDTQRDSGRLQMPSVTEPSPVKPMCTNTSAFVYL